MELSSGYNRPIGVDYCDPCLRLKFGLSQGYRVELCRARHAEVEATFNLIKRVDLWNRIPGAILYHMKLDGLNNITKDPGEPTCTSCAKEILDSGIPKVVLCGRDISIEYSAKEFYDFAFEINQQRV